MRVLSRITALLLLAVWLPVTEHCALEAAGVITKVCHDDGGAADQACATDGCATLESAHYRATLRIVQVTPPSLHDCLRSICIAMVAPPPESASEPATVANDRPKDWVPVWHFVRRAAPPSRAPTAFFA